MGLFDRPTAAAPQSKRGFTNVIKNEGDNTGRGLMAWRDPREDFNTNSTLIVGQNEEALFVNRGVVEGVFPNGDYVLKNQNIAIIRSFREALSGGRTTFPCHVIFVSTGQFNIPWGTRQEIGYRHADFDGTVSLRGNGNLQVRVADSTAFVQQLVRDNRSYTDNDLSLFLVDFVNNDMVGIIANALESNAISPMETVKMRTEICRLCMPPIQERLSQYGLLLKDLSMNLELDEDQRQLYEDLRRTRQEIVNRTQGEARARQIEAESKMQELSTMGTAYQTIKGMDLLKDIANNPGGGELAGAGAGLGMGMAAGNAFGSIAQNIFGNVQQRPAQQDPMEVLLKMKQLLDAGLINQQQYDTKVAEVMSRM